GTLVHTGGTLDVPIIKLGSGGTLQANSLGGNTGASGFTFDGGTLKTTASFTTTVPMTLNAGGGTVDTNGFNPKLNGMIDGSGALTKTGAGTMELTGTNTYSGGTTVLQGGLRPRSAGAMGSGTVSIADGANFMPWFNSGSSIITNDFVLNGLGSVDGKDAIYADGGGAGFGEYTISGQITLNATSNIGGHVTNHLKLTGEVTGPGGLTKGGTWGGGTNILTLAAHNTYAGPTTITQGTLKLGDAGAVVANAGFETPAINWSYDPAGAVWAFASAGIASNGSPWFIPDAPEGNQGGFVQKTGNLSQSINFTQAGPYSLLFSSVGRGGGNGPNDMQVQIDGTNLLSWTPAQAAWTTYLSGPITLTAGSHTLNFAGQISPSDKSSVVDLVRIVHDRIPDGSAVSISAGATLDLNNTAEMIGPLSGAGGSSVTLGSGALIVNSTANSTFSGAISGTGELYKTGPAQLLLNGASTYSGGTTVADGIVRIDNGQALGTGAVSVADGASLMFWASSAMTVENDIILRGMGPGPGRPALNQDGGAGLVTINGNVLLAATSDIGVGGSSWNDMRINGIVSGPGGMVVKEENNTGAQKRTLFLSGANTYTGATDITSGTVNIQHNNALGAGGHTTGTMTWIRNGAALELQGDITTNEHAHFQGAGPSGGGAIRNISGTNTMTDSYAMDANSTIGVDAGTLVFQTTRPEGSLYDAPSGTYQLTKVGAGTLQFNGPNTYSGITYINEGTINIRNDSGLGSGGHTSGTMTWIRDGAALELQGGITINEHAHFQGSGPAGLGSIRSISGNNTMTDRYAMDADSTIGVDAGMLSLQNAGTATEGPVYEFGGSWHLTKVGAGQLRINGPSTYTGGTTIEAGIVRMDHGQALGTGAVSVADGASLMVWAPAAMTVANDITLNGMGISDTRPALNQDGGGGLVTLTGTVTLAATSDVGLGGSTSNDLVINGQITGPGGLVVDQASSGSGWSRQQTLILNANNDYSGGTNVTGGALRLGHANAAGPGDINVAGGANVLLWFNSGSNTVANNFTLGGMGSVAGGKDAIYADGGGAGYGEYVLSGQITLAADSNIGGHNINDLRITGKVTGSGGLTKGGGRTDENNTLFLANTGNDYTGATVVNAGTLLVNGSLLNTAGTTVTGGMLAGNGTIANNVDVLAGGTISAGDALGKLSIGGSYTSGGTMLAELGGTSPGVDYDWLAVTAIADLGGMVDVNLVDGFVPVSGDFFDVLTADGGIDGGVSDGLTGVTFDFADAPLPLTGQYWNTSIVGADGGPQALRLEVAAPEPSTVILAVLGLLGLTFVGWRKRKK
ncbi:MAG: autotransporter-associated beta strand repeat-containing protein, partial [Planctomycetes bacterium]|nr:autotransporter-associated beta strand repeat-containing protein [Planctomycetota bacterium]